MLTRPAAIAPPALHLLRQRLFNVHPGQLEPGDVKHVKSYIRQRTATRTRKWPQGRTGRFPGAPFVHGCGTKGPFQAHPGGGKRMACWTALLVAPVPISPLAWHAALRCARALRGAIRSAFQHTCLKIHYICATERNRGARCLQPDLGAPRHLPAHSRLKKATACRRACASCLGEAGSVSMLLRARSNAPAYTTQH